MKMKRRLMIMLKTNKTTTLTGNTFVDDEQVVYYRADINPDGESQIRQSIQNQELYDENKKECRKDFADFTAKVYEIEDLVIKEPEDEEEKK